MDFARRLRALALALAAALALAGQALALDSGVEVPALAGRVVDRAGLLDSAGRARVDAMLERLESTGKAQMAVLIADSLQGYEIESYSIAVVEKWQLGHKGKDNGILLVIAPNERRMRIEVGYGLEGELTDLFSRRVIDGTLVPYFREGRFADGILVSIERIAQGIGADLRAPVPSRIDGRRGRARGPGSLSFLFWVILILVLIGRRRRRGIFWVGGPSSRGGYRGGFGGGFGGGGGFSGGGGRFGGGGASGSW